MGTIASQITSLTNVYSTVYSGADQSKHQSPASLAFVWGIHRGPVNSPHKWPVTRKMFPFDDVIMVEVRTRMIITAHTNKGYDYLYMTLFQMLCLYHLLPPFSNISKVTSGVYHSCLNRRKISSNQSESIPPYNHIFFNGDKPYFIK